MIAMTTRSSIRVKPALGCLIGRSSGRRDAAGRDASGRIDGGRGQLPRAACSSNRKRFGPPAVTSTRSSDLDIVDLGEAFDHRPPGALGLALGRRGLHARAGVDPHPVRARDRPLVPRDGERPAPDRRADGRARLVAAGGSRRMAPSSSGCPSRVTDPEIACRSQGSPEPQPPARPAARIIPEPRIGPRRRRTTGPNR